MKKDNSKSFLKHFATISVGTIINVIVGLLTVPIITRIVDPAEYGQLSIFTLHAEIAVMILCIGLDQSLIRFYYREDDLEYKRSLLRRCWIIPVLISVPLCAAFLTLVYQDAIKYKFYILICSFLVTYIITQIINRFSFLIVRLEYDSKKYAGLNVLHKILYPAAAILLLTIIDGFDIEILTFSTTFSVVVVTLLGIIDKRKLWFGRTLPEYNKKVHSCELIKYGAPFILSMGIVTLFQGIDKLSLDYYCGAVEVGIYTGALNIIKIFTIIQTSFNSIWAPMAMEHYENNKNDRSLFIKACSYVTVAMFFVGISLIVGKDIFALFLGAKYREAASVLPCLIFYPIMYTISETTCIGIDFSTKSHLHIWVAVGACVVNFIGNTLLVPIIGGKGAAISTGFSYVIFFVLRSIFAYKNYPTKYNYQGIAILTTVVFCYALYNTFFSFSIISIFGYVLCLLVMFVLYKNDIIDGIGVLKSNLHIHKRGSIDE